MKTKSAIILVLVLTTIFAYWQVGGNGYINFDDPEYLYNNPYIQKGLTAEGLRWALSSIEYGNWHPLTWIAHMTVCQIFGIAPTWHHLTNLTLHAANSVLLFILFCRMTGTVWRSAATAALFALHPLHVESVAWAAELKDLLSSFCGLLCIYCYARYAEIQRPSRYLLALLFFAVGLTAKPMLVTLPFLLLLLDYWPLQRMGQPDDYHADPALPRIIREKLPFIILSIISCAITVHAQSKGMALRPLDDSPLNVRFANALTSYAGYLGKLFWPSRLAVLYPYPTTIPLWQPLLAGLSLLAASIAFFRLRRRHPYFIVGWLWYLGTLVPVIGFVRVGMQSMADRYLYLPMVGIFIAIVWGIAHACAGERRCRYVIPSLAGATLLLCAVTTYRQVAFWRNNFSLYGHTLAVTGDNFIIHNNLGFALEDAGRLDEAADHFRESIRIAPWYAKPQLNLGITLRKLGHLDEAGTVLTRARELQPDNAATYTELGNVMFMQGNVIASIRNLETAIRLDPRSADAHYNLGLALSRNGRTSEAIKHFTVASQVRPDDYECHYNLGVELARAGQYDKALRSFARVLELNPDKELSVLTQQGIARIELLHHGQSVKTQP